MSSDVPTEVDVLFAGGGSGGHLFPGLAVATALSRLRPDWRLHFVGSDRAIEHDIMQGQAWPHTPLPVMSPSVGLRRPIAFLTSNGKAWSVTKRFWKTRPPRAVVGLGGFASVPALWVASRRRTPMVLLEQNAIPGRATRWFAKSATTVCLGFEEAASALPSVAKTLTTGNPVRDEISALGREHPLITPKTLLILGGSQGAGGLNRAMAAWVVAWPHDLRGWQIVHQAGPHDVDELTRAYHTAGLSAQVNEFIADMAAAYSSATMVIARAGATTLSELACAGLPAILVPFPHAADNHQRRNAASFVQAGAAVCVEQQPVRADTAAMLAREFAAITNDPSRLASMSAAMKQRGRPDAAEQVARLVLDLADRIPA